MKTTNSKPIMEQDNHWKALREFLNPPTWPPRITTATPVQPHWFDDEPNMSVGGASLAKKPRKPRRRKEVTADKFIVVRVTEELYQKVQSASELAGTDTSKWVRQAVLEQLSK